MAELLAAQEAVTRVYVEPFAGGAAVGLSLLTREHVEEIVLNDLDAGVAAFWRAVFDQSEDLARLVRRSKPSVTGWRRQREIMRSRPADDLKLAFATLYLNRCNRSGILRAGPIGGLEQTGNWGIGARFNAPELADRILRLGKYRSRVTVCQEEGAEVAGRHLGDAGTFVYADPPYVGKGARLYLDNLTWSDHQELSTVFQSGGNAEAMWLLTYDTDRRIARDLYPDRRCASFGIAHRAAQQHMGREYAIFSDALRIDTLNTLGHHPRLLRPPAAPA